MSLDGFGAGPAQDLQHPLGVRGPEIMSWVFPTRMFCRMQGMAGGETGRDNEVGGLKHDMQAMTAGMSVANKRTLSECIRIVAVSELDLGGVCMVDGHPDRQRIEVPEAQKD